MTAVFAQQPIARGRRKSRGGYPGKSNRSKTPRNPAANDEPAGLRHLVAVDAPQNPHFEDPTTYYAEKVVDDLHRPPSRQGYSNSESYAKDYLLHERLEPDSEDEIENPFTSVLDVNSPHGDHYDDPHTALREKQKYNDYIPPQLFSPNFSLADFPVPPNNQTALKDVRELLIKAQTRARELQQQQQRVLADASLHEELSRMSLRSAQPPQQQQQRHYPNPIAPPGLPPPPHAQIPTHKPRVGSPPRVSPPPISGAPGPIQRPQASRPLPNPSAPPQGPIPPPPPAYAAEPLTPPGLGPFPNHKNIRPTSPARSPPPTPALEAAKAIYNPPPLLYIFPKIPEAYHNRGPEGDALLREVGVMFKEYHRVKAASVRAANWNAKAKAIPWTAPVVPTHFNPMRRVNDPELWVPALRDYIQRHRIDKRTSRLDKKYHYLELIPRFRSNPKVMRPVRPPSSPSPFLLTL